MLQIHQPKNGLCFKCLIALCFSLTVGLPVHWLDGANYEPSLRSEQLHRREYLQSLFLTICAAQKLLIKYSKESLLMNYVFFKCHSNYYILLLCESQITSSSWMCLHWCAGSRCRRGPGRPPGGGRAPAGCDKSVGGEATRREEEKATMLS